MGAEMFIASRLKIKRANKHIQEFQTFLDAFIKTDFYCLSINKDPKTGNYVGKLIVHSPSAELALIIGDTVHNLRSALDALAYEAVEKSGGQPDRTLRFPIFKERNELIGQINARKEKSPIFCIGMDIVDLILDRIQPYKGGNDSIYGLNRLNVGDKHKLLTPVLSITQVRDVCLIDESNNERFERQTYLVSASGDVIDNNLFEPPLQRPLRVTDQGKPSLSVLFSKGTDAFEGEPVLPTLHQISQAVACIVDEFEKAILARV